MSVDSSVVSLRVSLRLAGSLHGALQIICCLLVDQFDLLQGTFKHVVSFRVPELSSVFVWELLVVYS